MHTEKEIRAAIKPLVESYGVLNTSEVKQKLEDFLEYDKEDRQLSATRNEMLIIQRIGNIVAHQTEQVKTYQEGFIVDKSVTPALFYAVTGLSQDIQKVSEKEVQKRQSRVAKKERQGKMIDWASVNEKRTRLGSLGEQFVFEYERDAVSQFDAGAVDRVIHLSAKQGDGFGYDILSLNEKGETVFIEVKTTAGNLETPFYMSRTEKEFFEEHKDDNAFVYRVYHFSTEARHGQIVKIPAEKLLHDYHFDPVSFMVTKKSTYPDAEHRGMLFS
ncbi:MAG: DUF3883 domain-containing protein [Treponemataceae bacterium]|nr:DUF3883 domain-containing protein [Treponemataceae bacterium]MDE7391542.1 DUF3883 domain-containing protein [Treponemataceae bacterium]